MLSFKHYRLFHLLFNWKWRRLCYKVIRILVRLEILSVPTRRTSLMLIASVVPSWTFFFLFLRTLPASWMIFLSFPFAGNQKLAAIGIRVSKWIAFHGLALNVTTDLTPFNWIVPCGIRNRQVGNVKELLREVDLHTGFQKNIHLDKDFQLIDTTFEALLQEFSEVFQLDIHQKTIPTLERFMNQAPKSWGSCGEISYNL